MEMQRLFERTTQRHERNGVLFALSKGRVRIISAVSVLRPLRRLLVLRSGWQMCGTVVPHCDFHSLSRWKHLKQGVFPYACPRSVCARAPTPAHRIAADGNLCKMYYTLALSRGKTQLTAYGHFAYFILI